MSTRTQCLSPPGPPTAVLLLISAPFSLTPPTPTHLRLVASRVEDEVIEDVHVAVWHTDRGAAHRGEPPPSGAVQRRAAGCVLVAAAWPKVEFQGVAAGAHSDQGVVGEEAVVAAPHAHAGARDIMHVVVENLAQGKEGAEAGFNRDREMVGPWPTPPPATVCCAVVRALRMHQPRRCGSHGRPSRKVYKGCCTLRALPSPECCMCPTESRETQGS